MISKQGKAWELFQRAANGPTTNHDGVITVESYRFWASTWLLPQMAQLIPQLKDARFQFATSQEQTTLALPGYTTHFKVPPFREPCDHILQVYRAGKWLDIFSPKTQGEFNDAINLIDAATTGEYRMIDKPGMWNSATVYARDSPTIKPQSSVEGTTR